MVFSTSFSAETQGEFFKAEAEMIRFSERIIHKPYAKYMKKTLLAIDAVFAVRMPSEVVLPVVPLIVAFDVADWKYQGDVELCLQANRFESWFPEGSQDVIVEALHYMQALEWVATTSVPGFATTVDTVLQLHEILLNGKSYDGRYHGFRSKYLPHKKGSRPEHIHADISELCEFSNKDLITPLGQASVLHHSFERIVPFDNLIDRTGLLFAFMPMFRRGLYADGFVLPICWGAALEREFRKKLKDSSRDGVSSEKYLYYRERWASYNARNTHMAVVIANSFLTKVDALRLKWRSQGLKIPTNSAIDRLLDLFLAIPRLATTHAADIIGKSYGATNEAMHQLVKAGIVVETALDNRERVFVCQQSSKMITYFVDELIRMGQATAERDLTEAQQEAESTIS